MKSVFIPLFLFVFLCILGLSVASPSAALQFGGTGIADIKVYVRALDGSQLAQIAQVTLMNQVNQVVEQATTRGGFAELHGVQSGGYTLEVIASGYEKHVESLEIGESGGGIFNIALQPGGDAREARASIGPPVLSPSARKELAKSSEALRANNLKEARIHLDRAYQLAPSNPEVNYLFGLYFAKTSDWSQAKTFWQKTLSLSPDHLRATLALSEALIREKHSPDAIELLNHAADSSPDAWRPHALLAEAYLQQGALEESIHQSERALELGHVQALSVEPILVRALLQHGDKQRAIDILRAELESHPDDFARKQQLQDLEGSAARESAGRPDAASLELPPAVLPPLANAVPSPSNWLPPDIDEQVPAVVPGHSCDIDAVLSKVAARTQEFIRDVDKYTATELLFHESINKWGLVSNSESLSFNYLVSIEEIRPGSLSVEEHRESARLHASFPDNILTNGLPSLPLIFHPYYSSHYAITCEGVASWDGGSAYQVYFRQRSDQPNTTRYYRIGISGPAYPAALKGRAWISVDSYQIVRMEAALVEPIPAIQLYADFTVVEYGPVHFKKTSEDLWLPKSVEYYYDWRGKRAHRHHKFDHYLLFSIDDKQRISDPKLPDPPTDPALGHVSP